MLAVVYLITNNINGKIYVGKSKYNNPDYYGSGLKINYALNKYGKENFTKTILEECNNNLVDRREVYWIEKLNATDDTVGYNISIGGQGGNHYWKTLSNEERAEHREKIRIGVSKRKRKPHSEKTKRKMSQNCNQSQLVKDKRAASKRIKYIVIDHKLKVVYTTNNIKDFCSSNKDIPSHSRLQHNSRSRSSFCDNRWSCRVHSNYRITDDIIEYIEQEVEHNIKMYKKKMIESRKNNV